MKPIRTIGQYLPSPKDPIATDEITCIVYEVPCKDCDFVYVGLTKRDLNSRLKEHQRAIKQQKNRNFRLLWTCNIIWSRIWLGQLTNF